MHAAQPPVRAVVWDFDNTLVDSREKNLAVTRRIVTHLRGTWDRIPMLSSLESYEEDDSVAKARAFVTACKFLRAMTPVMVRDPEGNAIQLSPAALQTDEEAARRFVASRGGSAVGAAPAIKFFSGAGFRR